MYKKKDKINKNISVHTIATFWLGIFAIGINLYIGFRHIGDADEFSRTFAMFTILEGIFCLTGLYLTEIVVRGRLELYPKEFKPLSMNIKSPTRNIVIEFAFALAILYLTQFVIFLVPLTIPDIERGLAIVFASVCEELFFRMFLIEIFIKIGNESDKIVIRKKRPNRSAKEISIVEILGIILSAIAFALLHVNYYGQVSSMVSVFLSGLFLGVLYWWTRNVLPLILAHFVINWIAVMQQFGLIPTFTLMLLF